MNSKKLKRLFAISVFAVIVFAIAAIYAFIELEKILSGTVLGTQLIVFVFAYLAIAAILLVYAARIAKRVNKKEESNSERLEEYLEVLSNNYQSIYKVDFATDKYSVIKPNSFLENRYGDYDTFSNALKAYVEECVGENDRANILDFINYDKVRDELELKGQLEITFRDVSEGTMRWHRMLVVGIGEEVIFGFSDCDDEITTRFVVDKLNEEYASIFLVDVDTDSFRFIFRGNDSGFDDVPGGCYTDTIKEYVSRVDPEYRERWNLLANIDTLKDFLKNDIRSEYVYPLTGIKKMWRRCVIHVIERDDNGYPLTFIMTYMTLDREAAEKSQLTAQIASQKEQLELQQMELENALYAAKIANEAKTTFLFNMSHDIRTPMNAIIGFNKMAMHSTDDKDKLIDYLGKVQMASKMLLDLINDVLEVSRIEANKIQLNESYGDVLLSYANFEDVMYELAMRKNINLTFNFGAIDDRYVYCDFSRAVRVLTNVIGNAIKYTNNGGWVKVTCEQIPYDEPGYGLYRYTVEDNGIGMSKEFQEHLFEQFSREENSTVSKIQGTGLGLSLSKDLVTLMGGTISCESEQGKGSKFIIDLPLRLQAGKEFVEPNKGTEILLDDIDFEGKYILVVEDNEMNLEIAKEILEESGLKVEEARDGTEAVELVKKYGPRYFDAILMDIQMPIMDGYQATALIRKLYPDANLPIIALSANAFDEDKKKSLQMGMDAHIAKPIDMAEFKETLAKFLLK